MRPLYWGLISFIIGVIGFLSVEVYYNMITLDVALVYIFAAIAICSLPIAVVAEIFRWRRGKEEKYQKKE